jgi:hypothetical protein
MPTDQPNEAEERNRHPTKFVHAPLLDAVTRELLE